METTEPKPIGTEIERVFNRLRALPSNDSEPKPNAPGRREHLQKLDERGYPPRHVAQLATMHGPSLARAEELWPRVHAGDCLLLLIGDRGPGKTQMATWWAFKLLEHNLSCGWYRKTADLISEIKRTWADGGKTVGTEDDVLRKYRKVPFLVLDEFHERGASDWESRTLNNIIDHRYDAMLGTIIIANMSEADVRRQVSASIVSRAEETGGMVLCDWPSYRQSV